MKFKVGDKVIFKKDTFGLKDKICEIKSYAFPTPLGYKYKIEHLTDNSSYSLFVYDFDIEPLDIFTYANGVTHKELYEQSKHVCQDNLKHYVGLTDTFNYCSICDRKFK